MREDLILLAGEVLKSLYAYKHAVNGYHTGWGYEGEPNYIKEDINKIAETLELFQIKVKEE